MTVSKFTIRVSGNASLADDRIVSFLKNWDSSVLGDLPDSNLSFRYLYPSQKTKVESLTPYTISSGTVTPSGDPTDSAVAVTAVSMVISGEVAFEDNTVKSFEFEIQEDGNVYNHFGTEAEEAWTALAENSTANAIIDQIFTELYSTDDDPISITITV